MEKANGMVTDQGYLTRKDGPICEATTSSNAFSILNLFGVVSIATLYCTIYLLVG